VVIGAGYATGSAMARSPHDGTDEATRSAWCREQGLYLAELDTWKQDAIAGLGDGLLAVQWTRGVGYND
jgi:hypothetical protein